MPDGRGFRFRGYSPPWPYIGLGRGGLPRCWALGSWGAPSHYPYYEPYYPPHGEPVYPAHYGPPMSREQELHFLKNEMDLLKQEMENINARIKGLEKEE